MNIWDVVVDVKNFEAIYLTDNDGNILSFYVDWPDFRGQLFSSNWSTPKAKFGERKTVGNFVDLDPGVLICDSYAWVCLEKHISNEVEALNIDVEGLDMKILNITNIVDCLDEDKSEAVYFTDSEEIMRVKKYFFNKELLDKTMLFKIPQLSRSYIFATDSFREKIIEYKLTGLEFKLL